MRGRSLMLRLFPFPSRYPFQGSSGARSGASWNRLWRPFGDSSFGFGCRWTICPSHHHGTAGSPPGPAGKRKKAAPSAVPPSCLALLWDNLPKVSRGCFQSAAGPPPARGNQRPHSTDDTTPAGVAAPRLGSRAVSSGSYFMAGTLLPS